MREAIIRTAVFGAYAAIFLVAVSFAIAGYSSRFDFVSILQLPQTEEIILSVGIIAAIVGALIGFVVGSVGAAVILLLREIQLAAREPSEGLDPWARREEPPVRRVDRG